MTRPVERVEELYGTWTLVSWTRRLPDDPTRLTDADRAELYNTMVAYAGTFTFDGAVATCHVDVSWNEAWTGTAQVRHVRFEGDRLVWSTDPQTGMDGRRAQSVFVWEKLRGPAAR